MSRSAASVREERRTSGRTASSAASGPYLAITVVALALVVYFAFLLIGLAFRLLFIAAAALLALMAWRAWRRSS